jgi:hypothetical protein
MIYELFNRSASVYRPEPDAGAWGAVRSLKLVGSGIPCRIRPASGREWSAGKVRDEVTHKAYFPIGTDLLAKDVVEIGGVRYEVVPPVGDAAGAGHHLETWLKEYA